MRFFKARSQPLPIAHEFEVEEFFGLACAYEELAVVLDLHKEDALLAESVLLLSGEEGGLWFGEVGADEIRPCFGCAVGAFVGLEDNFFAAWAFDGAGKILYSGN